MWNKAKSANLSLICTRVLIVFIILAAVFLSILLAGRPSGGLLRGFYGASAEAGILYVGMSDETVLAISICAYSFIATAIIALFSLDIVLRNIVKNQVFCRENVKCLRIISWCCFVLAAIMFCAWPFVSYVFAFVAAAAAFFGLLMRVFKNVIDSACEIKDENDFTI